MSELKDKPAQYSSSIPIWRRRRTWLLIAAIYLLYSLFSVGLIGHSHGSDQLGFSKDVDWQEYAYSQYATNQDYLCNSVMLFDQLASLGSKAERILFYPKPWDVHVSSSKDRTSQLLVMARDKYKVKLKPVDIFTLKREHESERTGWDASINKLHAWDQHQYRRIIHLDSDITLQQNIDELFFVPLSPGSPVAMPRAYWLADVPAQQGGGQKLTSLLIVLEPTLREAQALWDTAAGLNEDSYAALHPRSLFDMELLNDRYLNSALVLPHRPYALVTGEFRRQGVSNHTQYLGNKEEKWDAEKALAEAKLVHFSDWPLPKPHIMWPNNLMVEIQPKCDVNPGTAQERGCEGRQVWKSLYDDFRKRRKDICRLLSVPAPQWPPHKKQEHLDGR